VRWLIKQDFGLKNDSIERRPTINQVYSVDDELWRDANRLMKIFDEMSY